MAEEAQAKLCASARQELAEHFGRCGALMAALGDETRQAIVLALLTAGPEGLRVGEITAHQPLAPRRLASPQGAQRRRRGGHAQERNYELLSPRRVLKRLAVAVSVLRLRTHDGTARTVHGRPVRTA